MQVRNLLRFGVKPLHFTICLISQYSTSYNWIWSKTILMFGLILSGTEERVIICKGSEKYNVGILLLQIYTLATSIVDYKCDHNQIIRIARMHQLSPFYWQMVLLYEWQKTMGIKGSVGCRHNGAGELGAGKRRCRLLQRAVSARMWARWPLHPHLHNSTAICVTQCWYNTASDPLSTICCSYLQTYVGF